jgi:hypothetical protein
VAVHQRSDRCTVNGGVIIRPPSAPDMAADPTIWLAYHGVETVDGTTTVLFKAVGDDWRASRKTTVTYEPGSTPSAPDWDPEPRECGGGLHLCARPWIARECFYPEATRYVAVPVRVADIRIHPDDTNKVRVPGACAPVWECDLDGNPVTLVRECRAETGFAPNQLFALFGGPGVDLDVC